MFTNYFKNAWRSIFLNRTTALINIIGLSVGLTAAVLILIWVQNEMNFDQDHLEAGQIYRLKTSLAENHWIWETTPLRMADAAKEEVPEIDKISRLYTGNLPVISVNDVLTYEKKMAYVDDEWFSIFKYDFIEGNAASFAKSPISIILTASAAKKYFGNRTSALGLTIFIDSISYEVKGIVKDALSNSSFQYDAFLPLSSLLSNPQIKANDENWGNFNYLTFVKLKSGTNTALTAEKLTQILRKNDQATTTISLVSLKEMHFENDLQSSVFVHGNRNTVYIFSILAFLLLLVACINYVNLTTAKASIRAKEVSIRKILGARRIDLFWQFTAESLLTTFISLCTTLVLLKLCLPIFNSVTDKTFALTFTSVNIWQIIGIALVTSLLLNSIYPSLQLSSFKPLSVLRGVTFLKINGVNFRKGLVVLQFTISVVLIASTIIIYKQMNFVQKSNPGYNRSQVLSFALPPGLGRENRELYMRSIKQDLISQSNISDVTIANQPIINIGSMSTGSADWNGRDTSFNPKIAQLSADADFLKTMQLEMKEGRWFEQGNEADKSNVILNEAAVSQLNIPKPVIGQRFTFKGRTGQIIGVVKDFSYQSMHDKTGPLIAFNDPQWYNFFMVRISPKNILDGISEVQKSWNVMLPGYPLEYTFLDESFNNIYKEDQQASFLTFVFSIIAVILSSLGLFGLAAFTAEQRTKEIGIRKVLGASVSNITTMLSKDFIGLVGIAILIATPIAYWAMDKWLEAFAYKITINWWMFAFAGFLAVLIALITVSFHAIKAAIANPVKSLRTE